MDEIDWCWTLHQGNRMRRQLGFCWNTREPGCQDDMSAILDMKSVSHVADLSSDVSDNASDSASDDESDTSAGTGVNRCEQV